MSTWRRLDDTRDLATVVVIEREGEHAVPPGDGWSVEHLSIPRLDVSSTEVRARLARGFPVAGLVPARGRAPIRDHGLYAVTSESPSLAWPPEASLDRPASAPPPGRSSPREAAAKMGRDIVVLDVAPIISIIDCFVLVSASNTRQVARSSTR